MITKYKIIPQDPKRQFVNNPLVEEHSPCGPISSSDREPCGFYVFIFLSLPRPSFVYPFILTKRSTWAPFPDPFPGPFPWLSLYTVGYKLDGLPVAAIGRFASRCCVVVRPTRAHWAIGSAELDRSIVNWLTFWGKKQKLRLVLYWKFYVV